MTLSLSMVALREFRGALRYFVQDEAGHEVALRHVHRAIRLHRVVDSSVQYRRC